MNKKIIINNEKFEIILEKEDLKLIHEFIRLTTHIKDNVDLNNFAVSVNISGQVNETVQLKHKLPCEKELSTLLLKIRPLMLQSERTYFIKLKNLITMKIDNVDFKDYMKNLSEKFLIKNSIQSFKIEINNYNMTTENAFKEWLNSEIYHFDEDKRDKLEPIINTIGDNIYKAFMIEKLILKFNCILELCHFFTMLLTKEEDGKLLILNITNNSRHKT